MIEFLKIWVLVSAAVGVGSAGMFGLVMGALQFGEWLERTRFASRLWDRYQIAVVDIVTPAILFLVFTGFLALLILKGD